MSIFTEVFLNKPSRNWFELNHERKFSCNEGKLVPVLCQEVVPSDKWNVQSQQLIRFAPLVAPMMQHTNVYTHYFFVPKRLLWANWEDFITGGEDGEANPVHPYLLVNDIHKKSTLDYLGFPTFEDVTNSLKIDAMPLAAYNFIYNEYYRDQNLQTIKRPYRLLDGDQTTEMEYEGIPVPEQFPLSRAWEHDYFTSALPWAQKGPEVTIPLGETAAVEFINPNVSSKVYDAGNGGVPVGAVTNMRANTDTAIVDGTGATTLSIDNSDNLSVDLSTATASSINDLRRAFKLQEWLERMARGGSRYIEVLKSHFNQTSSDARLQRPEYLGGGKSPVSISEVLQTSATVTTPQANMAGHGINLGNTHSFSRQFEEHGYIIGIMSVMPKPAYQGGLPKQFFKFDRFDHLWPTFANLGEQPILNKELFIDELDGTRETVFGYTPRYAEYRYIPSTIHGDFIDELNYWHQSRIFASQPTLNAEFIECNPTKRVFAITDPDEDSLYCHVYHKINALRPLPMQGIPTI